MDTLYAIRGATLIDGNGGIPIPNSTVIVDGGYIQAVGADLPAPKK